MKTRETLLENLCRVNGAQGGTIHQFCDISKKNFFNFEKKYYEYSELFVFNDKESFKKLAKKEDYFGLKF